MALFESYERRIDKINSVLAQYGISSVEECRDICKAAGFDPYDIVKGIQPICCLLYTSRHGIVGVGPMVAAAGAAVGADVVVVDEVILHGSLAHRAAGTVVIGAGGGVRIEGAVVQAEPQDLFVAPRKAAGKRIVRVE